MWGRGPRERRLNRINAGRAWTEERRAAAVLSAVRAPCVPRGTVQLVPRSGCARAPEGPSRRGRGRLERGRGPSAGEEGPGGMDQYRVSLQAPPLRPFRLGLLTPTLSTQGRGSGGPGAGVLLDQPSGRGAPSLVGEGSRPWGWRRARAERGCG